MDTYPETPRARVASPRLAIAFLIAAVFGLLSAPAIYAASCCGGGSGSTLVLPKYARYMADVSTEFEVYDGFWNGEGAYLKDPAGSDLRQHRLNLGVAARLAPRWQAGLSVPFVRNDNRYSGVTTQSQGAGDVALNLWYETFDGVTCVSRVRSLRELKPAAYLGAALTIPTGISPFDDHTSSMEITGRGFYRLDGSLLLEKTVYPFNASLALGYGAHLERPVNREYGRSVEPYHRRLGNRATGSFSLGYTHMLESLHSLTFALGYSRLWEGEGTVNGAPDPAGGLEKRAVATNLSFASVNGTWVARTGWSHAVQRDGWGKNFPATDTFSMGVGRVFH